MDPAAIGNALGLDVEAGVDRDGSVLGCFVPGDAQPRPGADALEMTSTPG